MPPARKSATSKPAARASRATQGVRARAASTKQATRREVEQSIARFEKRLDDANDALKTLGGHLGRGSQRSYKEVTAALAALRREATKTNKQALKDFDSVKSRADTEAPGEGVVHREEVVVNGNEVVVNGSEVVVHGQEGHDRIQAHQLALDGRPQGRQPLHRIALDLVTFGGNAFEINAREEGQLAHALEPCAQGSSVTPASICVGSSASSSTAPRTRTPSPNVTSPCTTSRSASRNDGGPSGKRSSKSSSSL